MPRIRPVPESEATAKVERTYSRVKELLGAAEVPEPFLAYGSVPTFLQDFFMNFKRFVYEDGKLDARTKAVLALAVSAREGCDAWIDYFTRRALQLGLKQEQVADIFAVSSANAMYNVFFKFRDICGSDLFSGLPVGLRAHTFGNTSLDEKTVELINTVISDLNACKPCTSGHVDAARRLGISDEAILEAVQCAATVVAGTSFLKAAGC
mgnify:CR=1 FL=1